MRHCDVGSIKSYRTGTSGVASCLTTGATVSRCAPTQILSNTGVPMLELIERLEKATGPDRELGNSILFACGWTCIEEGPGADRIIVWEPPDGSEAARAGDAYYGGDQPDPTASIDAALTLVPDKWTWNLHSVFRLDGEFFSAFLSGGSKHSESLCSRAPNALCAAALKARAAITAGKHGSDTDV